MNVNLNSKLVVLIVLLFVIAIVAVFDVKIASRPIEETREGIIVEDQSVIKKFTTALENAGISYELENNNGRMRLTWDKKFSERVDEIKQQTLNIISHDKPGTCFPYVDSRDRFTSKLDGAFIKYEIRDEYDGMKCVYWETKDDPKVLELDRNIKEIRQLEESRI